MGCGGRGEAAAMSRKPDTTEQSGAIEPLADAIRSSSMNSAQLRSAGELASIVPDAAWFASYYGEEGDPDLYLQDLVSGRMWKIDREGERSRV